MTQSIDPQWKNRDANSAPSYATTSPCFTRFSMRGVALFTAVCPVVSLGSASQSFADTITGTVTDPSGAVVAGAQVEIRGDTLPQKLVLTTDAAIRERRHHRTAEFQFWSILAKRGGRSLPVFADFGQGLGRMGQVGIVGNSTRSFDFIVDRVPKKVLNAYKDVLER
jgi:hypothetical protein